MREAKDRCAVLSDVEPQTFIRFAQFIYTGDYSVPNPNVLVGFPKNEAEGKMVEENGASTEEPAECEPQPESGIEIPRSLKRSVPSDDSDDRSGWGGITKKARKNSKGTSRFYADTSPQPEPAGLMRIEFSKRSVNATDDWVEDMQQRPRIQPTYANQDSREETAETFLAHARVYVFGDTYGIKELIRFALYKLRQSLSALHLLPDRVADLITLVHYSYANTPEGDGLRHLVANYCAYMIEELTKDEDFTTLTREYGVFTKDMVCQTLLGHVW